MRVQSVPEVLRVGHVGTPPMGRLVRGALAHGDVAHEMLRGGAVPVLFVRRRVDDVARTDLVTILPAALNQADALRDVEGLPETVGVPGRAGPGSEVDEVHLNTRRVLAAGDGIDVDVAGEPFGGTLAGRLFGVDLHECFPLGVSLLREAYRQ